jgi:hypothetical protein
MRALAFAQRGDRALGALGGRELGVLDDLQVFGELREVRDAAVLRADPRDDLVLGPVLGSVSGAAK